MGLTRRWGIVVSLAIVTLFAYCHASDTPNYNCYNFIRNGKAAERSNDKSVSRQHRKRGASGCDGPHCAAIEPRGDIVIEVDSYYEAVCLFNPQHINKQDVRFKHVENSPEKSYQIQPVEVSDSAIRINVSHSEAVEYKLQCLRNDSFLCERTVKVGYMPQDVENFTCISKNWQTLNCTWTIPYNPVQVIYNLTYVVVGLHNSRKCPTTDKQLSSCFWEKENFDTRDKWVMTFKARNNLTRHQVEYNHTVHVFETVIPDPPKDMVANVIGPHVVNITWMLPFPIDVFYDGGVIQQVSYRERRVGDQHENAPWQEVDQWRVVPNRFKKEIFSKNITNLRPYTLYDFRVRLHTGTGAIREHMWSDEEIRTERTIATRPTRAPKTDIGTFEVENTIQYREIFINWQRVDPMYWNGPSFRYDVTVFDNEDGRLVTLRPENIEIEDAFAKFTSMNKSTAYRFVIRPVNDVGQAAEDIKAEVVVPEMSDIIEPLTFFRVTAINGSVNTIYMTRWSLPADEKVNQMIKSLTLYWCKKDKYEHRCKNKLEWVNIEDTSITAKNVTYLDSSIYMFGISANSLNSSSGIKWVNCIASYDNPPPPLTNFKAVYVTSTEVKLKWSIDCKAIPTGFNISYCNVTGNEISCPPNADVTYEILNDETLVEHIVRNLHPYTYYIFNIAVLADSGLGKWSKSEKNQTKPYKPSGPPQDLEVKARGQEWVLLAWKPPLVEQRNGRMSQYKIIGEPHLRSIVVQALHNSDIIEFNVTDLTSYTNYTFQVIPCTEGDKDNFCGDLSASLEVQTRIGAPGKISSIDQDDNLLKWDHDECFAPECSFQLLYRVNGTNHVYNTSAGQTAVNFKDLNISCTDRQKEIYIGMRAISKNEDGLILTGPMKDERINCPVPAWPLWIIMIIAAVCIAIALILVVVGTYGWDQVKAFMYELNRKPTFPTGLDPDEYHPPPPSSVPGKKLWHWNFYVPRDPKISSSTNASNTLEAQDLINTGSGKERQGRNMSGDSGTSEGDPGDSSGCSVGGESDSSSGSDHVHQSSCDSGTGQEEHRFSCKNEKPGSVRLNIPGSSNLRLRLPFDRIPNMGGYVSAGSVPNLAGGIAEAGQSLQQSTPSLALGILPDIPLEARRTSTGYISMPDTDAENLHLAVLGNLTLPHEGRGQNGFPAYSRHNFPHQKTSTPDLSPYTKPESLPWFNTGNVTVAQAEGGGRDTRGACGYVAVGDAMGAMKRQPSPPSLDLNTNKSQSTQDETLPTGAYCRVGARGSPGPPPGYVSITQDMLSHTSPAVSSSSPINKTPYVTCAMAESIASPKKEPEKVTGDYVAVGDARNGRWAHPVMPPSTIEESREVASAPIEGSRGRPSLPTRPNTSETNHNRGGNRWTPVGPSLSKQSSGYVSGNVSQETLSFHDPVVMSPKKLLAQSHEPHSVVYSPNHKPSMV
ncbi:uncharacterized protein LOC121878859 isoform X7 [Homarus americanus]|uniref:uncharacterized protein LOC121878859 isoform X7 n=1 Tax=Homarus americanus TaxID=6706 RepID=UPI001C488484|nr:uncharacterized protein LOC121878859 isoform X7 [Homarus americanus]